MNSTWTAICIGVGCLVVGITIGFFGLERSATTYPTTAKAVEPAVDPAYLWSAAYVGPDQIDRGWISKFNGWLADAERIYGRPKAKIAKTVVDFVDRLNDGKVPTVFFDVAWRVVYDPPKPATGKPDLDAVLAAYRTGRRSGLDHDDAWKAAGQGGYGLVPAAGGLVGSNGGAAFLAFAFFCSSSISLERTRATTPNDSRGAVRFASAELRQGS